MTATTDGAADQARNAGRRAGRVVAGELKNFMTDVEQLVTHIADVKDADVARLRSKVQDTLVSAKESLENGADDWQRRARQAAGTADDYVRVSPWQAVGVAAIVGLAIGYVVSRRF